tara:strand:+ start:2258 stop:2452 length:195 start_codon:yes stop_codon:yes gene_type:complete
VGGHDFHPIGGGTAGSTYRRGSDSPPMPSTLVAFAAPAVLLQRKNVCIGPGGSSPHRSKNRQKL